MDDFLPPACQEQQHLMDEVQKHLIRISELSRAIADALRAREDNLLRALDHECETELGRKERALGALRQHRKDHGC